MRLKWETIREGMTEAVCGGYEITAYRAEYVIDWTCGQLRAPAESNHAAQEAAEAALADLLAKDPGVRALLGLPALETLAPIGPTDEPTGL